MSTLSAETEQIVKAATAPEYLARLTTTRDARTGRFVPFCPWPHQARLLQQLRTQKRLAVLHAEGTGSTTATLAYVLWRLLFQPGVTVRSIGKSQGETLVKQVRHLLYRLPRHLRTAVTVENHHELTLSTGSRLTDFDPGHDLSLIVADGEGWAEADRSAARQIILLSRPGQPEFDALYRSGRYAKLFVPCSARPGRVGSGVESEAEALGEISPEPIPDFYPFVQWAWPLVSKDEFTPGLHVEAITHHLQLVADGKVRKLLVNCPIRHGKSLLTSVLYPVYRWLRDPALRVMSATYSQDLTLRDAGRSRALVEHPTFRERYGRRLALAPDNTRQDFYYTTAGGYRFSTSVGARTSGFDADAIVADDIHDFATRRSQAERQKAIDYFETALSNRLVVTGKENIVLAGHRVHEDDVYRAVQEKHGQDWTYLILPAEAEPTFTSTFYNPHWQDPRSAGELLWPAKFGPEKLAEQKRQLRHDYSPVYLQKPTPPEGSLFQTAWFRHWSLVGSNYRLGERTYPQDQFTRILTVDLAIGQKATSDWTVAQVWDCGFGQMVLVHQARQRVDGARVIPLLQSLYKTYSPALVAVESVAYQQAVIDQLRALNVPVRGIKPVTDKESRSVPAQVRAESGQVWVPQGQTSEWVADWLAEIAAFPNGTHDDQVDALSMAALLAERYAGSELDPVEQDQPSPHDARLEELLWAGSPF